MIQAIGARVEERQVSDDGLTTTTLYSYPLTDQEYPRGTFELSWTREQFQSLSYDQFAERLDAPARELWRNALRALFNQPSNEST